MIVCRRLDSGFGLVLYPGTVTTSMIMWMIGSNLIIANQYQVITKTTLLPEWLPEYAWMDQ